MFFTSLINLKTRIMNRIITLSLLVAIALLSCNRTKNPTKTEKNSDKILIIFDTDMGNDIDDALALVMLNNYIDLGKIDLLGVISSKDNVYSVMLYQICRDYSGLPDIRTLKAHEIRFFYDGLREELKQHTKPK